MLGWSRNFPTGKELTAFIPCPKNGTMAWAASPISTQCDFRWKGEHFTDIMGWAGNRKKSLTRACLRKKAIRIWTGCLGLITAKFFYTLASLPWYFDEKKKDNDNSKTANGGGCSSVEDCLSTVFKVLGSIPRTRKKKGGNKFCYSRAKEMANLLNDGCASIRTWIQSLNST